MTTSYYDVVLLGTHLEALLCGGLLAKRGFRVLLLGQDDLPPTYTIDGIELPRRPSTFLATHSPVARKIFAELAMNQIFRRRAIALDPPLQVVLPRHRLDLPLDAACLDAELEREFPEVRRAIDEMRVHCERAMRSFDALVDRDLAWPPETFVERRELASLVARGPFDKRGGGWDPLADFPEGHPFRWVVRAATWFAGNVDPREQCNLGLVRLFDAWSRGAAILEGGETWLREALLEKIRTYSGEVRDRERAEEIVLRRGAVEAVRIAGSSETIGCTFVVAASDLHAVLRLLPDRSAFEPIFERWGEPQVRWLRYTLNVLLEADGVPEGMGRDVVLVRDHAHGSDPSSALRIEAHPTDDRGRRLLCVEALLARRAVEETSGHLESTRERILATLGEVIPFLGERILFVDSPHDDRPAQSFPDRREVPAEAPWTRGPATMSPLWGFPVQGALGVCAVGARTPVKRLLLCNRQVVPGLGLEGSFLAAFTAARIVTKADRKKEWMRRGLFTKVEI